MYSLNPWMTENLTNDRVAELNRHAAQSKRRRSSGARRPSIRHATGWALVELGLRIAVRRRGADVRDHGAVQPAS